jgi:hypothetical protein
VGVLHPKPYTLHPKPYTFEQITRLAEQVDELAEAPKGLQRSDLDEVLKGRDNKISRLQAGETFWGLGFRIAPEV